MTKLSTPDCPNSETLSNFLLGKLDPTALLECESHLAECEPCVETVSSLKIDDTFHALVVKTPAANFDSVSEDDQRVVSNLIGRMIDTGTHAGPRRSADQRAADVIGMLDPPRTTESIGQLEHYRFQTVLGCGSTGVVFQAVDENLERPVAIKVLRPTLGEAARQRFIEEARATARLDHPNIVTIFHVGESGPVAYIVMQWLPGETLEQRLERESVLPLATVKKFGQQIALGLAAAHEKGLVHRDIKPANLWITNDDQVKILDFGLVRIMDESPQLTCTGMIAGTPCFMSPEQSRGDELDARSDLFSLGCVLYQSLTGTLPFVSDNALATLQAIQRVQPADPSSLEPSIDLDISDLVMCLLEKSPYRRPESARDVSQAFESPRADWPFQCVVRDEVDPVLPRPKPQTAGGGKRPFSFWSAVAWSMLGLIGLAAIMFGPQMMLIATNQGEILIESNDPDVQVEIRNGDQITIVDLKTEQSVQVDSGTYQIRAMGEANSVVIDKQTLTLSRGKTQIVKVTKKETSVTTTTANDSAMAANAITSNVPAATRVTAAAGYPAATGNPFGAARSMGPPQGTASPAQTAALIIDPEHRVAAGDILSVFIDDVLGNVHDANQGDRDHLGVPIHVRSDGTIALPHIAPIPAKGSTALEIENLIRKMYVHANIVREGAHFSVVVKNVYTGSGKTKLSEPVYDGMTFEQCLNAIQFERDGEKLLTPFIGAMELKHAEQHPEIIEPLWNAMLQIDRTGTLHESHARRFAVWLTDEQLRRLVLSVSESESDQEWSLLRIISIAEWKRLKPIQDDLLSRWVAAAKEGRVSRDKPLYLLGQLLHLDLGSEKTSRRIMDAILEHAKNCEHPSSHFSTIVRKQPSLAGLGEAVAVAISEGKQDSSEWRNVIGRLDIENQKAAIGEFTTRVLEAGDHNSRHTLTNLDEPVLKIVEPIVEKYVAQESQLAMEIKERIKSERYRRQQQKKRVTQ